MIARKLTILLIEDSQTYALLASSILDGMGHSVEVAGTAEEGLVRARELIPTVILMDINLPGMNGYEAVRQIRQDSLLRYVPVIAMTVTEPVNKATIEMGIDAGFTGHTQKPIHENAFRFVLDTYLEG
jgi:CheY-like chemotaxis protein